MKTKITMIELFSGIGSQVRGFQNSGLWDVEVVATSEIDKDAMLSYSAIHCGLTPEMIENYEYPTADEMIKYLEERNIGYVFEKNKPYNWGKKRNSNDLKKYYLSCILSKNMGDITKIRELPYCDMLTYSFPCTDISVSGEMKGIIKGQTRSGLLYEVERLLFVAKENNTLPKYLLLENVKNLVGKQFKPQFDGWCAYLESIGYNTYWEVINSKDCGIPQNRERVFAVSIRKDIDMKKFCFPLPFDTGIRLKDILEEDVDDKYYIDTPASHECIEEMRTTGTLEEESSLYETRKDFLNNGIIIRGFRAKSERERESRVIPLNDSHGVCRTIKAQYGNTSIQNFKDNGKFGATGVLRYGGNR